MKEGEGGKGEGEKEKERENRGGERGLRRRERIEEEREDQGSKRSKIHNLLEQRLVYNFMHLL